MREMFGTAPETGEILYKMYKINLCDGAKIVFS
jgi:hypothetical protein